MKVNKSQALMFILSLLIKNGHISKDEVKNQLEISDLTFRRYIQEVRAYIANFELRYELVYIKNEDAYFLKEL